EFFQIYGIGVLCLQSAMISKNGVRISLLVAPMPTASTSQILKGLETGMHYLRSRAEADAIKFTVDTSILKQLIIKALIDIDCTITPYAYECKYVRSGCTTALNVVPWETDGESVLREAMTNTIVTTPVNKMFFYLITLNLARFLNETAPQVEPPKEGKLSNAQAVQAVEAWKHSDFLCHNYVLNGLVDSLYNVYCKTTTAKEL
ncbi:pol polyprotein, partial [Tanacetum coccineum]